MKKILYLSNVEVPYRVRFFNELAKYCDLTVLYEREKAENRNEAWAKSESGNYSKIFLNGIKMNNDSSFSFKIIKYILGNYDHIIVGAYNSPVQMFAVIVMRILHIPYILSTDGKVFLEKKGIKTWAKCFFLKGADKYLVAGENAARELQKVVKDRPVFVYNFSSLTDEENQINKKNIPSKRENHILIVGIYYQYKGLDVAVKAAKKDKDTCYRFVGMGNRSEVFIKEQQIEGYNNIQVIPFLPFKQLIEEMKKCKMLILPSRKECWGLVINEAASLGTPIVSTWGCGAGLEFLEKDYPQYLAQPGDSESLYQCIKKLKKADVSEYKQFLANKAEKYSIEKSVKVHLIACDILEE